MTDLVAGNILGAERAESDNDMLARAFVETSDFRALTATRDFNYVVGRRGTGKTALSQKVAEHLRDDSYVFSDVIRPQEHEILQLQSCLSELAVDYRLCRASTRIAWKVLLLISFASHLKTHWKVTGQTLPHQSKELEQLRGDVAANGLVGACGGIFRRALKDDISPTDLPALLAERLKLSALQKSITAASDEHGLLYMVLFDGLDEGWEDSDNGTGLLGGLAVAAADLRDAHANVQATLFFRDNIFRSLAAKDADFSRHIEGSALRLHWDRESLLTMVANRLRVALDLPTLENNEKVWNRFVGDGLRGRDGFSRCLHYTLYRPRDILVLLNQAAVMASRAGAKFVTEANIEVAAEQVSKDRLLDLQKEYGQVFPGLSLAVESFRGGSTFYQLKEAARLLDSAIASTTFGDERASELALLGSGRAVVEALYSVGFIGVAERGDQRLRFCHDGSAKGLSGVSEVTNLAIHPCYWRGLNLRGDELEMQVALEVFDDQESAYIEPVRDVRMRQLGEVVSELPNLPTGDKGATDFEQWVLRAVRILFGGDLSNVELHPNRDAVQRRDVVATVTADGGFWRRILDDYDTRQVVFEVKNYPELKQEDYRQILSYLGKQYGRLGFIVSRGTTEGLSAKERKWVKEYWHQHNKLIVQIPVKLLAHYLNKLKNPARRDYAQQALGKRLDTYLRSYIA